jgi:nucleoside-diphosphate-sugar epimerase
MKLASSAVAGGIGTEREDAAEFTRSGRTMNSTAPVVIFGGTGFIGTHLAQHLLRENLTGKIVLVDLLPPRDEAYSALLQEGLRSGRVEFAAWDVRKPISDSLLPVSPEIIFNLAAVHKEPGHKPDEYFETNLSGAENVCAYASAVRCQRMVFTSSISPYGPSEELKDETSLPMPETPYGSSKLIAETIHLAWQAAAPGRKLLILRPGVVFGPGEDGNVTRLIRSVVKGYFVYVGNRGTRKAGGYVKELCFVIQFGLEHQDRSGESITLLNFSMDPPPALEEYVETIGEVAGRRRAPLAVPRFLLLGASYFIDGFARASRIKQPVSPVRVRKLFRSTCIDSKRLRELGYTWRFSLKSALDDWKRIVPRDFLA